MPQPTIRGVHSDEMLSDISVAFMQDPNDFIASTVFPVIASESKTDTYYTFDQAPWFREETRKRAPGTQSAGTGYTLSEDSFIIDVYALHVDIDDQTLANADQQIELENNAVKLVTANLMMTLESEWHSTFMTTGIWAGSSTGNDQTGVAGAPAADEFRQWNNPVSTPIQDIQNLAIEMKQKTGLMPNTLVLGLEVFNVLTNHPDFEEKIKYTETGIVVESLIASVLRIDRVIVSKATRETAAEGATSSMSFYAGKTALLLYVAPAPGKMIATSGYTFAWTKYAGTSTLEGLGVGSKIRSFREENIESLRVEGTMTFDQKVVSANLGIFLASAIA